MRSNFDAKEMVRSGGVRKILKAVLCRSDHTALMVELQGIAPIPSHRPCPLSSALRFKKQRTLVSMFGGGSSGDRKRKAVSRDKETPEKNS